MAEIILAFVRVHAHDRGVAEEFEFTDLGLDRAGDAGGDPGAATLKCPYCGATREKPKAPHEVTEHPIEEGLRAPRDLGWGVARKSVRCTKCGATVIRFGHSRRACCPPIADRMPYAFAS